MSNKILSEEYFGAVLMTPCRLVQGTDSPYSSRRSFGSIIEYPLFFWEADFSRITLTVEVTSSSEMLVPIYQSTKCLIPQEWYICQHCFESLNGTNFYSVTEWPPID